MNRIATWCFLSLCFAASAVMAWSPFAPKISFERRIPAPHNLGTVRKVVLVELHGSGDELRRFSDALFAWQRGDTIEIVDGRSADANLRDMVGDASKIKALTTRWPDADAFLGVRVRGCNSQQQSGTTTEKDKDGTKHTVIEYWVTADCSAEYRIVEAATARQIASAEATGKDESSRSKTLSDYLTSGTIAAAAADTAHNAYRSFAPRKDKQTLVLEKSAPSFKEGINQINANQYAAARSTWESALAASPNSAALHLNLAEICEVLGDRAAAKKHYEEAARLDSSENHRRSLAEFERRQEQDEALAKRP